MLAIKNGTKRRIHGIEKSIPFFCANKKRTLPRLPKPLVRRHPHQEPSLAAPISPPTYKSYRSYKSYFLGDKRVLSHARQAYCPKPPSGRQQLSKPSLATPKAASVAVCCCLLSSVSPVTKGPYLMPGRRIAKHRRQSDTHSKSRLLPHQ